MNKDVVPRLKGIRIEIVAPDPGSGASYAERVYDIARRRYMIFLGLHTAKRKSNLDNAWPVCIQGIAIAFVDRGDRKWLQCRMTSPFLVLGLEVKTS